MDTLHDATALARCCRTPLHCTTAPDHRHCHAQNLTPQPSHSGVRHAGELAAKNEHEAAEAAWRQCMLAAPRNVDHMGAYASFLGKRNREEEAQPRTALTLTLIPIMAVHAKDMFEAVLNIDQRHTRNLRMFGNLLADMGKDKAAEAKLTAALAAAPEDDLCLGDLAEFHSSVKDQRAGALFDRAIAAAPGKAVHKSNYAAYLSDVLEDSDKARDMHLQAVAAEPEHHGALGDMAEFLNSEGEVDEAEVMYKRSVAGCMTSNQYVNYALFLMEQERWEDAEVLFQQAIQIDPKDADTAWNYSCYYARQGCETEAIRWLRTAVVELQMDEVDWDEEDLDGIRDSARFQAVLKEHAELEDAAAIARLERYELARVKREQYYAPGYHYDMMHDSQRNEAYFNAIKEAICNKEDVVVEIGSGSGLLALMAASLGCAHVVTIEGNPPVAAAAKAVVAANKSESVGITVLSDMSTTVKVDDLPGGRQAAVLVAEIFDTALIGEGVLPSFIDAHSRLVKEHCRCVPHKGTIFAAGIRSARLRSMDVLAAGAFEALTGAPAPEQCAAPAPVFQIHGRNAIRQGWVEFVTDPVEVLTVEFASPDLLQAEPTTCRELKMLSDGSLDGVMMWWRLDMNPEGTIVISTDPLDQAAHEAPPRAHWQQGASIFRQQPEFQQGAVVKLRTSVKGWNLFFDAGTDAPEQPRSLFAFPALPRHYLLQMSEEKHLTALKTELQAQTTGPVLVVSDGPLALCAAAAVCGEVIVLASSTAAARVLQSMAELRAGANVTVVCHEGDIVRAARGVLGDRVVRTIVAEPYCHKYATWDEGMDGIAWGMDEVAVIRKHVLALCGAGVADAPTVLPHLKLLGRAFQCEEFRRRRLPVGDVLGFDLRPFNEHAPYWRQFEVKRGSLSAYAPTWVSERIEGNINWTESSSPSAVLKGDLRGGQVDGMIFWLEDGVVEVPESLDVVGIMTPQDTFQAEDGSFVTVEISGEPLVLRCDMTFG